MKKTIAILLTVLMLMSVGVLFANAEENGDTEVYVTIADKDGKLVVTAEKVAVTDIDNDSVLTINDALYAAHEQFYEGGAAAGYESYVHKDYGLSLKKLWGDNSGSFSYQLNNGDPVWNLAQQIKADDYIAAYIYRDTKNWSDTYLFFDRLVDEDVEPGEITLTLQNLAFDADYNTIKEPTAGAEITVDGKATGEFTDENGKATVTITEPGEHLVSATMKDKVIVSPVYRVLIAGEIATPDEVGETTGETVGETAASTEPATAAATEGKESSTKDSSTSDSSNPNTGDRTNLWLWALIAGLCLCGSIGLGVIYKKHYAK